MKSIFYLDPQSGDNLAMYDFELLSRIKGHNIFYVCSKTYNYETLTNLKFIPIFNYTKKKSSIAKGISYTISLFKLFKQIKEHKPDIIHIQWFRIPCLDYYFYSFIKAKYKTRIIHTVHNILPHVKNKSDYINYSKLYGICDRLITHTATSASELSKRFAIPQNIIYVAPHGPLKYKYSESIIKNTIDKIKREHNVTAKYIITLLGYQSLYKGTDLAINAWIGSSILSNNKDICLIIAGQPKDYKSENYTASNLIVINQKLSDIEFTSIMKMTSLIILPYRKIDQSGVLLTILEEEIPYCATDVGELCRPFEIGDIGWIFKQPTIKDIRDQLESILDKPFQIEEKRNKKEVWSKIKELYSWGKAADITNQLYKDL